MKLKVLKISGLLGLLSVPGMSAEAPDPPPPVRADGTRDHEHIPPDERLHIACGLVGILSSLLEKKNVGQEAEDYLKYLSASVCINSKDPPGSGNTNITKPER